jgi:hypothetical protein
MKRRDFLNRAAAGAALAVGGSTPASPASQTSSPDLGASPNAATPLKFLFTDRRDTHNTWGQLRFGATPLSRVGDATATSFTVKYCRLRPDGVFDVWGFQGADHKPWKLFRCESRDGLHFENVRVVLERDGTSWAHTCSLSYSPELGRYLFLKNMNVPDGFSLYAFSSNDGEHWQEYEHNPVFYDGDRWGALWSPAAQKFVYYGKGVQRCPPKKFPELFANARRVLTLRTSPDGFHWTPDAPSYYRRGERIPVGRTDGWREVLGPLVPVEYQIAPDDQDPPELEFYAGDGFVYEGRYYLLMLNYAASAIPPGIPPVLANAHGPALDTEWWISRDGVNWDRPFRHIDAGPAFVNHNPMIVGGRMLFHTDGGVWAIPQDRLTYVTARANGVFETAQFTSAGRPMRLNARIPGAGCSSYPQQAYVMAELIDEADRVFPGYEKESCMLQSHHDAPDIPLVWAGRDGSELKGQGVRIRFYLRAADIFAVSA